MCHKVSEEARMMRDLDYTCRNRGLSTEEKWKVFVVGGMNA